MPLFACSSKASEHLAEPSRPLEHRRAGGSPALTILNRDGGGRSLTCPTWLTDTQAALLAVDKETARERLAGRSDHYFPTTLADSQFEALETLRSGIGVEGSVNPEAIVKAIRAEFGPVGPGKPRRDPG